MTPPKMRRCAPSLPLEVHCFLEDDGVWRGRSAFHHVSQAATVVALHQRFGTDELKFWIEPLRHGIVGIADHRIADVGGISVAKHLGLRACYEMTCSISGNRSLTVAALMLFPSRDR